MLIDRDDLTLIREVLEQIRSSAEECARDMTLSLETVIQLLDAIRKRLPES
jgi:hypothetical protein